MAIGQILEIGFGSDGQISRAKDFDRSIDELRRESARIGLALQFDLLTGAHILLCALDVYAAGLVLKEHAAPLRIGISDNAAKPGWIVR